MRLSSATCASLLAIGALAFSGGCGSKDDDKGGKAPPAPKLATDGDPSGPEVPAPPVVVGVDHPKLFNFRYGRGSKPYKAAEEAAEKADWAAVVSKAEEAIAADDRHLDARFLLARAHAELGDAAAAAEPLLHALSADYLAYAAELAESPALVKLTGPDSELGKKVAAVRQAYFDRAKAGLFVVARRTTFKTPKPKKKVQWAATRAELYAYDRDSQRFLRLTHTKDSLAGFIVSPSGDELAFVAYSGVLVRGGDQPPLLGWLKLGVLDLDSLTLRGKLATIRGTPRQVRVGYRAGDELLVETAQPDGFWGVKERQTYVLDRGKSRLKRSKLAVDMPEVLHVDYHRVTLERPPTPEIQADAEATSFRLLPTNTTVTMPAGDVVATDGYVWSPDKVHLVVRTMAAPCEDQRESSLYLVDTATGKLKNILRAESTFETRWIDNDHFVYQDDEGALRIYDVEARTQVGRIEERGGLGLVGLGTTRGPICTEAEKDDPGAEAPADADADEPEVVEPEGPDEG